jgi:putative oxidoreductase
VINGINDELVLAAPLLLATQFLIFGWRKLRDYSGTVSQMVQLGAPMPVLAAAVATFMELPVAFAVAVGAFARPSALLMFFYTLGTALIGHRYWTITGADRVASMDGFYKNLSIMGGFLLLYINASNNDVVLPCLRVRSSNCAKKARMAQPIWLKLDEIAGTLGRIYGAVVLLNVIRSPSGANAFRESRRGR